MVAATQISNLLMGVKVLAHIHVLVWTSLMPDFNTPTPGSTWIPTAGILEHEKIPSEWSQTSSYTQERCWAFTPWDLAEASPKTKYPEIYILCVLGLQHNLLTELLLLHCLLMSALPLGSSLR